MLNIMGFKVSYSLNWVRDIHFNCPLTVVIQLKINLLAIHKGVNLIFCIESTIPSENYFLCVSFHSNYATLIFCSVHGIFLLLAKKCSAVTLCRNGLGYSVLHVP